MKNSDVEEILQLGSFEKGLRAELCGRMRSERNKMLAYGLVFGLGVVIGLLIGDKQKER